jgi:hypothetical protein
MKKEKQQEKGMFLNQKINYIYKNGKGLDDDIYSFRVKLLNFQQAGSASVATFFDQMMVLSTGAIGLSFTFIGSLVALSKEAVESNVWFLILGWGLLVASFFLTTMLRLHFAGEKAKVESRIFHEELDAYARKKNIEFPEKSSKEKKLEEFEFEIPEKMLSWILSTFIFGLISLFYFIIRVIISV